MYPALKGIEERYGPTKVHLQVYDDSAHVLPILFSFTTPAKFCYRAVAAFCRHVTKMPARTFDPPASAPPGITTFAHQLDNKPSFPISLNPAVARAMEFGLGLRRGTSFSRNKGTGDTQSPLSPGGPRTPTHAHTLAVPGADEEQHEHAIVDGTERPPGMRRAMSATVTRAASTLLRRRSTATSSTAELGLRPPPLKPQLSERTEASETSPVSPRSPATEPSSPVAAALMLELQPPSDAKVVESPVATPDATPGLLLLDTPRIHGSPSKLSLPSSPTEVPNIQPLSNSPQQIPKSLPESLPGTPQKEGSGSSDVAGPRFPATDEPGPPPEARLAGDPTVYVEPDVSQGFLVHACTSSDSVYRVRHGQEI
jgi:hypothetical protein